MNNQSHFLALIRKMPTVWGIVFILVLFRGYGISHASGDDNWDGRFSYCTDGGSWFDDEVRCILVEDGAMFAGGDFLHAGGGEVNYIAYWNGYVFAPLDSGLSAPVHAIALDGNVLYAGGRFINAGSLEVNYIAVWNGYEWSTLGAGFDTTVYAIAVCGDDIYAGGEFKTAGDDSVHHIARWDGSSWLPLGTGMDSTVHVITVHDGDLYVGGCFTKAGGVTVNGIAKWNGNEWSPLGDGVGGFVGLDIPSVNAIRFDGSGDCYVGGNFTTAHGRPVNYIALWDGIGWEALDMGLNGRVDAIDIYDEGIVAGGRFTGDGLVTMRYIGLWNGSSWCVMGDGTGVNNYVLAVDVDGTEVYLAGMFSRANQNRNVGKIARWRDYRFYSLTNSNNGPEDVVTSLTVRDGNIIAGGAFQYPGCTIGNFIGMWNGDRWQGFGLGTSGTVRAVAADDNYVYAGGNFMQAGGLPAGNVARWNGSGWSKLGPGIKNWIVYAMVLDVSDLYVGGDFDTAGFVAADNIARWDGMFWSALESGTNGPVYAVTMMGGDLYAGGSFSVAGGVTAHNIARWDGSTWYPLSGGTAGPVYALASDGSDLYAGGTFASAGYNTVNNIAKWDGGDWSTLGSGPPGWRGVNGTVRAIAVCGGDVYAGGEFTEAGGDTASRIAVFTGGEWLSLGSGVSGFENPYWPQGVRVIACHDEGGVFVGGNFIYAGGKSSYYFGLWHTIVAGVDESDAAPPRLSLLKNYPNPFNPHTAITYEILGRTRVKLSIYAVSGELIATLVNEVQEPRPGGYQVTWDGRDGRGRKVSSGVYFCWLKAGHHDESKKLVLLK